MLGTTGGASGDGGSGGCCGGEGDGGGSDGGIGGDNGGGGGAEGALARQKHCLLVEPMPGSGSVVPKASFVSKSRKPFANQHLPAPDGLYPTVRPVAIIISMVLASIHSDELEVKCSLMYLGP